MINLANYTSNYRGRLILNSYQDWIKHKQKVLDIGCGTGIVAALIKQEFKTKVTGADVTNYLSQDIPFVKINPQSKLPFKKDSFHIVMLNDVLHHIPKEEQQTLIAESLRIAKKVLIFEIKPTKIGIFFDIALNIIHYGGLNTPFSHRSSQQWSNLFKKLKANYQVKYPKKPPFYPFEHMAYCISKG